MGAGGDIGKIFLLGKISAFCKILILIIVLCTLITGTSGEKSRRSRVCTEISKSWCQDGYISVCALLSTLGKLIQHPDILKEIEGFSRPMCSGSSCTCQLIAPHTLYGESSGGGGDC